MSYWKKVIERDLSELRTMNYAKINSIQQEIADLLQKQKLTIMEVEVIINGLKNHEMANMENAIKGYKTRNSVLIKYEGVEV